MREQNTKKLIFGIAVILLVSSFSYFQYIVPYHIFFKEQIQLFVYDSSYILSYFLKPGGLACLAGDFLTQFLYLKGGGAVVISMLIFFEWLLIVRILYSFELRKMATLWALFPVIVEWMIISRIDFSIAMSVAFALVLLAIFVYTLIKNKTASIIYGIIFVPVLYVLLGGAVFLFPAAILIYDIYRGEKRYLYWLTLIVLTVIIPYLLRSHYLITVTQAYYYPYTRINQKTSCLVTVLILLFSSLKIIRKYRVTILTCVLTFLFIIASGIVGLIATTNFKREKILGIATEAYFENWNKLLKMSEKSKLENPITAYYTNLALSKQMQLGDRMMDFYQPFVSGLFLWVNSESNWFTIFFSSDVFYHIGDMNMAQHSAMLGMIFSPYQRSSRLIQRLAEINVVTGDVPAAMKYIRMMESSLFHSKRAAFLKEAALSTRPDDYPWLQNKRSQIHVNDTMHTPFNVLLPLELLVKQNPDNRAALDYLLAYHLMSKNIPDFFNVYSSYCKDKTGYVPKVFAEALLIYFAINKVDPETIKEYNINPVIIKDFNDYTKLYESSKGNLELLKEKFPNTYWLFYHFAKTKT